MVQDDPRRYKMIKFDRTCINDFNARGHWLPAPYRPYRKCCNPFSKTCNEESWAKAWALAWKCGITNKKSSASAKDPKINRSSWKDCLGRVPPLEKVYHSKDAFIFPTSSKCNGFDVANQTRRTSWVCGFLGRPWCEDPREYMTWHIAILINTPWTPWFWTLSETYRFQLWKNADVFLCLDFFLKSTPLYCSLKQEDPWEQGINTLDELCAGDGYCWRCTFVKFLWKCLCGCIVRV